MLRLTDHKDHEGLVDGGVAVGGVKRVHAAFRRFQAHQPQLTAVAVQQNKESIFRRSTEITTSLQITIMTELTLL